MTKHVIDSPRAAVSSGRLSHFLRIERGPRRPWNRAATALWLRQRRDPAGRTLSQFTAIERGRRI